MTKKRNERAIFTGKTQAIDSVVVHSLATSAATAVKAATRAAAPTRPIRLLQVDQTEGQVVSRYGLLLLALQVTSILVTRPL